MFNIDTIGVKIKLAKIRILLQKIYYQLYGQRVYQLEIVKNIHMFGEKL
nr:MAG TPA: hypothetical protein [Caudoviricetes sp.]